MPSNDGGAAGAPRRLGRPAHEPATPCSLAAALLGWARQRGLDPLLLADQAGLGLEPAEIGDLDHASTLLVSARSMGRLLDEVAAAAVEPHLGLRLPRELVYRGVDSGALAARVAKRPRDVLLATRQYAPLVFPGLEVEVTESRSRVRIDMRFARAPRGYGYQVDAYLLASTLMHCRRGVAHDAVRPCGAWLMSPRSSLGLAPLSSALSTEEIVLGAESTGFEIDAETADLELSKVDPMLVAAAEQLATSALLTVPNPRSSFTSIVLSRIEAKLPSTAEEVAASLKMSGRTMQRRLEDEGVRFSALLDQARERVAKELLVGPVELVEVASRVGFSDLATFSRAFKRWTGMPPGAYRRSKRSA